MLAFAKQALHGNDPEVAIKVLDMQRQRNRAATSKRSWVVAFLVASAAVATGCTACATPMVASFSDVKVEASFSNIQIIIICILLVVVVRGARR